MKDNIKLDEGRKLDGTLNYKDFLIAAPNWEIKKENNKIVSNGGGVAKSISPYLKNNKELSQEAFHQACKAIRAIEEDMLDHKPNELKNIIDQKVDTFIIKYFGEADSSAYDRLAYKKQYAKQHNWGGMMRPGEESHLLSLIHQAAYAEAVVYKYFAETLKDVSDRRSGLKRALNNMSNQDKDIAKAWFKDHVIDISFIIPIVDDKNNPNVSITGQDGFEDHTATEATINKINSLAQLFHSTYPTAKQHEDYIYRNTSGKADKWNDGKRTSRGKKVLDIKKDDTRKDLWNWMATVTFDTKVADVPDNIKTIIADAKRQSTQDTKSMQEMSDDYTVSSVPLAQAILSLFNNDFNFYKNKMASVADGSDELINDYDYNK